MQAPVNIPNGSGLNVRTNINNVLQSIVSLFNGESAPNPLYPYQIWINTATTPSTLMQANSTATSSDTICELAADGTIQLSASSIQGIIPIANGGTGASTQQLAINALTGNQHSGYYLRSDGTNVTLSLIQASDIPKLNQDTTGTAGGISGILPIANGGTGQDNGQSALNSLVGAQSNGYYLRSDGTNITLSPIESSDITNFGVINIVNGGTGSNTASGALFNLGGFPLSGGSLTGALNEFYITATIASTMNIGAATANIINAVMGSTPVTNITAFDNLQAGPRRTIIFSNPVIITYNATSMILPGEANISVNAGDVLEFISLGASNWKCINYLPASYLPINLGGTGANTSAQALLNLIGTASQGSILYNNGTYWATLPPGTAGQVLQTQGAGENPEWVTPTSTDFDYVVDQLLDANGYTKWHSGKIEQWGNSTVGGGSNVTITFPTPFETAVFDINPTLTNYNGGTSGNNDGVLAVSSYTLTNFNADAGSAGGTFMWHAIGV